MNTAPQATPRRVLLQVRTVDNRRFEVEMTVPTTFDAYDAAIERWGANNLARVEVQPLQAKEADHAQA
ncbi:hypothetical protein [Ideonella paludis]|uniref:Uncharacterized protein n=1 Tax=Ideonella paludis TaxID=1233411 RepID=A0ABS5E013_9BURK|nr:hypothetical protein [Ideonella paludis]MBQ0936722.1 hypothetical protein [Ideonella paludis]